jgi:nucleotidyltransferase/DNA polymerase involved in DNA repair
VAFARSRYWVRGWLLSAGAENEQAPSVLGVYLPVTANRKRRIGRSEGQLQEEPLDSGEDTFDRDLPLSETEGPIRRLAEKVWAASRKEARVARTVVLKLKTSDFNTTTRSHTPLRPPATCDEFTAIALSLRERVAAAHDQRFRLVGVGLSNFKDAKRSQPGLFE